MNRERTIPEARRVSEGNTWRATHRLRRWIRATALGLMLAATAGVVRAANPVSSDDFFPPVKGGPTTVEKPEAVKSMGPLSLAANSAQDAINSGVMRMKKDLGDQRKSQP